jgi:hypothetical protein
VAPALQSTQRALQRNLAKANLYHALKHRPSVSELQERGVYVPYGTYSTFLVTLPITNIM